MDQTVAHFLNFLRTHQFWAGPLLCALAAFECLPLVGAFAPLTASLIALGVAIAARVFDPQLIVWIIAGCALGNGVSFEGGAYSRRRGLAADWIPQKARGAAEALFRRFGAIAIILSRFLGVTASVVPFLAGWSGLPRVRFWVANLFICTIWPPTMAAIGYFGWRVALG